MVYQAQQSNDDCYDCDGSSNDDDHDDDYHGDTHNGTANAVSRSNINAMFICLVCGGRGHAASVDGVECLTKQLGISIPRQELAATKYPNGLKYPSIPYKSSKHRESARYTTRRDSDSRQSSSRDGSRRSSSRDEKHGVRFKDKKKYVKRNARQVESEPEPESQVESEQQKSSSESSDAAGEHNAKFAVTYHTIDTSAKYRSTHEDSSSSEDNAKPVKPKPKPRPQSATTESKSATTKAKKI